ncbi:MAG: sugar transferase [Bryobacteraceae bacterium]|nr:sugar transferase [Bryobacteraceae bacterium]
MRAGLLGVGSRRLKRFIDLVLGCLLLAVSLPLAVVIGLAIWLESGAPVLFAHRRIGLGGRTFLLYKFRSMVVNADEVLREHLERRPDLALEWLRDHKLKVDPRVTRVGRFLRRRSLDEIPQFWNVLRGDMSLVGPRPIVPGETQKYGPHFRMYTLVRPGLTGLWQVSGRNDTSYGNRVSLDLQYIREWTPWLDLRILFRTVWVVLRGHGAY